MIAAQKEGEKAQIKLGKSTSGLSKEVSDLGVAAKTAASEMRPGLTDAMDPGLVLAIEKFTEEVFDAKKELDPGLAEAIRKSKVNAIEADPFIREITEGYKGLGEAAEESKKKIKKAGADGELLREFLRPLEGAADRVQSLFADTFEDIFSGATSSAEQFAEAFKRIMIRTAAEIAALMIFRPQISGMAFGGIGFGGGIPGVGVGGLPLAFGAGGGGIQGMAVGLRNLGLGVGLSETLAPGLTNLFSPAGILGGFAGNIGANLLLGSNRGIGANIGGTIGAVAGSFLPVPFLGTALGAAAGNFFGGLFGGGSRGGAKVSPETQAQVEQQAQFILSALGIPSGAGGMGAGFIGNLARNIGEGPIPGTVEGAFNFGMRQILRASEEFSKLGNVIDRIDFSNTEQAINDVQFALRFLEDDFGLTEENVTEAERAISAINQAFEKATETAERLGLETEKLARAHTRVLEELTSGFNESVKQQILGITDPFAAAMAELKKQQEQQVEEAKALGANLVELERLHLLQRQELIERFAEQEKREIESTLSGILRSFQSDALEIIGALEKVTRFRQGLSTRPELTSPTVALEAARQQFMRQLALAETGDVEAIAALPEFAETFVNLLRTVFASGPEFAREFQFILEQLDRFSLDTSQGSVGEIANGLLSQILNELGVLGVDLSQGIESLPPELRDLGSKLLGLGNQINVDLANLGNATISPGLSNIVSRLGAVGVDITGRIGTLEGGLKTSLNPLTTIEQRLNASGLGIDILGMLIGSQTENLVGQLMGLRSEINSLPSAIAGAISGIGQTQIVGALRSMSSGFNAFFGAMGSLFWDKFPGAAGFHPYGAVGGVRIPSFRHGGSFTVGGAGGPDSQLVAFNATPGERVTVMPRDDALGASFDRMGSALELTGSEGNNLLNSLLAQMTGMRREMRRMNQEIMTFGLVKSRAG